MGYAARDFDVAARAALFNGVQPPVIARVLATTRIVRLSKRQVLIRQGQRTPSFFIILDGWIKLYRNIYSGEEAVIDVLTRGSILAMSDAMTGTCFPATAEAICDVRVLQMPAGHMLYWMRTVPQIALNMIVLNSQLHDRLARQVEVLKTKSSLQRVAEFLASLCPTAAGPCVVTLPYEKTVIAGRLGMKPESLSRALAKLKAVGVQLAASCVTVRDVRALHRVCGEETPTGLAMQATARPAANVSGP